jgi:glycosyltransferase 2 family protein
VSRRTFAKYALTSAVLLAATLFIGRALLSNWETFRAQHLSPSWLRLSLAAAAVLSTCLLATAGWATSINRLQGVTRLGARESVALFNASSLTKYLPGKVWSYALQMYWLSERGVGKAVVAYVNLVNVWVSIVATLGVGFAYLVLSSHAVPNSLVWPVLAGVLIVDLISIRYSGPVFNYCLVWASRKLKREMTPFDVPLRLMLDLHVLHLLAAQASGLGVYFICTGIGFELDLDGALLVMAALLIADVVAFLAVFVPGGLGVRESVMFLLLGGLAAGPLGAVLPIACRLVNIAVDIALGAVALSLLRGMTRGRTLADPSG